jgi:hypothetical protein
MAESLDFDTATLRQDPRYADMFKSEAGHELPDVTIAPFDGPSVINRSMSNGHQIIDVSGERVGWFTLVGNNNKDRRYVRNIEIKPERQGERLAVAAYVGLLAVLGESGKYLTTDPQHTKETSQRIWRSLERRGLAQLNTDATPDVHGFPRYTSKIDMHIRSTQG